MKNRAQIRDVLLTVRGIGPKLANTILSEFGSATSKILLHDPQQVAQAVRGVSLSRAVAARAAFESALETTNELIDLRPVGKAEIAERTDAKVRARLLEDSGSIHSQRLRAMTIYRQRGRELVNEYRASGLHVGMKRRRMDDGDTLVDPANIVSLRFHFPIKIPSDDVGLDDARFARRLPSSIEGVPTDIAEISFTPYEDSLPSETADVANPLCGGIQIATRERPSVPGTLGGIVFSPTGFPYFLTNAHVAAVGETAIQPGAEQGDAIGIVTDSEMPDDNEIGAVDCAIISPDTPRDIDLKIRGLEQYPIFGTSTLTSADVHHTKVLKSGAKTGVTSGWVKSTDAIVKIGTATMTNQILVESDDASDIADGGDSGALLLLEATREDSIIGLLVVGLVHARSSDKQILMASHFAEVANRLNIRATAL